MKEKTEQKNDTLYRKVIFNKKKNLNRVEKTGKQISKCLNRLVPIRQIIEYQPHKACWLSNLQFLLKNRKPTKWKKNKFEFYPEQVQNSKYKIYC
jgi:hypothetical protein